VRKRRQAPQQSWVLGYRWVAMDFLGSIKAQADPPGIDLERWRAVIASHRNLAAVEPVVGVNPFTKGPFTYRPHPGDAPVVVGGKKVGEMTWPLDGSHEVDVWGEDSAVEDIARDVAGALGASYERWQG
jgi:hypothetical protein